jgi:hypothetical protein
MLLVGGLLVAASFAASDGDTPVTRKDQYYKQAYDAAEAGVNYYLAHLVQNTNYWANCYTSPIQAPGTAFSTATSQTIPGSEGRYEIELLKPPGSTATCSATLSTTVIDPATGQMSIRSTGSYRGVRRSIIATFKRQGFLNFLWLTDLETPDPVTYPSSQQSAAQTYCTLYHRDGRPTVSPPFACGDQSFRDGDALNGPGHTTDEFLICNTPSFGRTGKNDSIEATDPAGWRGNTTSPCSSTASPQWVGSTHWGASNLQLPSTNASLKSYANSNWIFSGPVHIFLSGSTATVKRWNDTTQTWTTSATGTPSPGIIYVQNSTSINCPSDFATRQTYPAGTGCGDAWVQGNTTSDLTVAADNDVIIDGHLTHGTSAVLGLIANGFVRLYHPCSSNTNLTDSPEDNNVGATTDLKVQAAVLALNHSFWLDNYGCGAHLGTLHVTGAIAQEFRGTVGLVGSNTPGYIKDYNYDPNLKYHQPPYFLDPVQAKWDVMSQTEQVPAH